MKLILLFVAIIISFHTAAQTIPTPLLAVKVRYLFLSYGAGAEMYFNRKNSVHAMYVTNAYSISPSIDFTIENACIIEYRKYLSFRSDEKPNKTYLAPYYKYSRIKPGQRGDDFQEWTSYRNVDHNVGLVIGRRILFGEKKKLLTDLFVGPQIGYRRSTEKFDVSPEELLFRYKNKFICGIRAGIDFGVLLYKKAK